MEKRTGALSKVNSQGVDTWHAYKVSWNEGVVQFYFDNELIGSFEFSRFSLRYFLVGKDDQYEISDPAPVISNVRISEFVE